MNSRIFFLGYLSRSGSTLLAKKLDNFKDIGVSIEAEFVDGITNGNLNISSEADLDKYITQLYTDCKKFVSWGIDRNVLKRRLNKRGYPIPFKNILEESLEEYFKDEQYLVYFFKGGSYYRYVEEVQKQFPDSGIIYIDRDPRAIFNSQKISMGSSTGKPMKSSVVEFIRIYKSAYKIQQINKNDDFFYSIKYENLILNEKIEIENLIKFIGVTDCKKSDQKNYYDKIPDEQKYLHKNLKTEKQLTGRIDAWMNELSKFEIYFMQKVLKKELRVNGYKEVKLSLSEIKEKGKLLYYFIQYYIYSIWDFIK